MDKDIEYALISCIELVVMRKNGDSYHLIQAKLGSLYDCKIADCADHPEFLRQVMKEVYKERYDSIIEEIKAQLGDLIEKKEISDFFKIMQS